MRVGGSTRARAIVAVGILLCIAPAPAGAESPQRRLYAVIIASSGGPGTPTDQRLQHADDDAARISELFEAAGAHVQLLTDFDDRSRTLFPRLSRLAKPPVITNVLDALQNAFELIEHDGIPDQATGLWVIVIAHGQGEDGAIPSLALPSGDLTAETISRALGAFKVDSTQPRITLVIDACNAGALVSRDAKQKRPGHTGRKYEHEFATWTRGIDDRPFALILASMRGQSSFESSDLAGSYFSNSLRSALLGGADADGNQIISATELDTFLRADFMGVAPEYRPSPLIKTPALWPDDNLFDLRAFGDSTILELSQEGRSERYELADGRGLVYAILNVEGSHVCRIALLWSPDMQEREALEYDVRRGGEEAALTKTIADDSPKISVRSLEFKSRDKSRGPRERAFKTGYKRTPFGPQLIAGVTLTIERLRDEAVREPEAPARNLETENAASELVISAGAGYSIARSPFARYGATGVQHGATADLQLELESLGFQIRARYGFSAHPALSDAGPFDLHELAVILGPTYKWNFPGAQLAVRIEAGLGPSWVVLDVEPAALEVEATACAALGLEYLVVPHWRVVAAGGLGIRFDEAFLELTPTFQTRLVVEVGG